MAALICLRNSSRHCALHARETFYVIPPECRPMDYVHVEQFRFKCCRVNKMHILIAAVHNVHLEHMRLLVMQSASFVVFGHFLFEYAFS